MIIFPAIDIKEGRVVRLLQGKFDEITEYSGDPIIVAKKWKEKGAKWIHIVDLDGAQHGQVKNLEIIINIVKSVDIPIQMGGGIRNEDEITKLIEGGVSRIILGTKAIEDRKFLKEVLKKYRGKVAVSLDCNDGIVAQRGWTSSSGIKASEFAVQLEVFGLECLIYTDISKDGAMKGPNFEGIEELLNCTSIPIIAAGGISNLDDISKLKEMQPNGLMGAIVGKALYEGKFDLNTAINVAS